MMRDAHSPAMSRHEAAMLRAKQPSGRMAVLNSEFGMRNAELRVWAVRSFVVRQVAEPLLPSAASGCHLSATSIGASKLACFG